MNYFENDKKLYLLIHDNDFQADMKIIYECKEEADERVIVSIEYDGKTYSGHGYEYLGIEAFADLQKQLPEGVRIKSCLSCRYGNQCPVGNAPNELFCTKDVEIKWPEDLWVYTEDEAERKKRLCTYSYVCKEWQEQSKEYFTYNDFVQISVKEDRRLTDR